MASVTPNMNLVKWDSVSDYFSHAQLAANFQAIDDHDHTSGKGTQIGYGGLGALSVGASELRTDAVIEAKIQDSAVTTNKINNLAVSSGKLASSAVTTAKLATGAVTSPKVALTNGTAAASASLTLSGSYQDIAGCTLTFTPSVASTAIITGMFDFSATSSTSTFVGELQVDGVSQLGNATFGASASGQRASVSRIWHVNLSAASHTIKLRASYFSGSGNANLTNTQISYVLFSQ